MVCAPGPGFHLFSVVYVSICLSICLYGHTFIHFYSLKQSSRIHHGVREHVRLPAVESSVGRFRQFSAERSVNRPERGYVWWSVHGVRRRGRWERMGTWEFVMLYRAGTNSLLIGFVCGRNRTCSVSIYLHHPYPPVQMPLSSWQMLSQSLEIVLASPFYCLRISIFIRRKLAYLNYRSSPLPRQDPSH